MAKKNSASKVVIVNTTPLPPAASVTLQWDAGSGECHAAGPPHSSAQEQSSAFQATGPPVIDPSARPYWRTGEVRLVPALSLQVIGWEQEAARVTFSLDPALLADTAHAMRAGATGELVWVHELEESESLPATVHPVLLVHASARALQEERVIIAPAWHAPDPLLHHIALVLQAALAGGGVPGRLYAESLADALVLHFLKRYRASRLALPEVNGGLSPYKLRRTTAYIQANLAQPLSLVQLAAVGQTSPAHFARLFKHATGLAPHQYVIRCRMASAKRLLAETDLSLSEIGLQIGCADQSHFTALFRTHAALTPKAYRDHTGR
jgi:AraC-like DNA-binding protein